MSRIRGKGTKPELAVAVVLGGMGVPYRMHAKDLPGSPDFVLAPLRACILVHGCFWHCHSCQQGRIPGTRPAYWEAKLAANKARDRRNAAALRKLGWRVLVVWECQALDSGKLAGRIRQFLSRADNS